MGRADDVASLFERFGASSDVYLEIENSPEYQETPAVKAPVMAVQQPVTEPVEPPQSGTHSQPEPQLNSTFQAKSSASNQSGPLSQLLAEVAQARQAEAVARNNEALAQAMSKEQVPQVKAHVIAVISAKGGVGKSTLSATLASTVKLSDGQTLAIDLDPQNALRHHLNVSPDVAGVGAASLNGEDWRSLLLPGSADTQLLPYGSLQADEQRALEHFQDNDPDWLKRQLARMQLNDRDVVILDVPTGDSRVLRQALNVASQVLVVLTADAACYLTLDQLQGWLAPTLARTQPPGCGYVINQFDAARTFNRDMHEVMVRRLGDQLLGLVHRDPELAEALAYGHNPMQAPNAAHGTQDLQALGDTLISLLNHQGTQETRLS
jgi:cellulose synthase operon protein YhjQ